MNLKELYSMVINVRINEENYAVKIEPASHPREHAVLISLVDPTGEPKHFTLVDKEVFKMFDKEKVMKEVLEPKIMQLKARVTH